MTLNDSFLWIESTSVATAVRESAWLFPTIETAHVLAIALVVGSIMVVDLRLLNLASRGRPVTALLGDILPWTWIAFSCAALTGGLLFSSSAVKYSHNLPFLTKMLLLALAAANMLVVHFWTFRSIAAWDEATTTSTAAKIGGGLSLAVWVVVVGCGRWVGFV
jgi:hypothetical protein